MLYAVKGNTQLKIEESEKAEYLKLGYDIAEAVDGALKIIETSPTKTVPYKEYEALSRENAELKKQVAASGSGSPEALAGLQAQLDDANKEVESLKAQLDAAKKAAKADK